MIKFIDLFAGVGGFRYGLEKVSHPLGYECVWSNEWDKYCNSVYRKHFVGGCDARDIRAVSADGIPGHDLLCGGFPCQAFSVAGKRRGFEDTRGTLFFEVARIIQAKQPRYVLLENVKGLLSHDGGRTFLVILTTLDELGYDLQWQVLNSKDFGVPQNRERVFIVGHLRGTPRPEVFPITQGSGTYPQEITQGVSDAQRIYRAEGIAKTLKGLGGGLGAKTGLYAVRYPLKFLERNQVNIEGDYAYTVDSVNTGGVKVDTVIRRLTPLETERLQGFPDNWTQLDAEGMEVSDSQRYKMMGNAVTTNVVTAIGRLLAIASSSVKG
jgi:DNA (cytosine-5)-methyltransferase 1